MLKRKISCLPCRSKKVKCDGEKPCQRCAKKETVCSYQKPGAVGRPPKNAVVNKLVLSRLTSQNQPSMAICREFISENASYMPLLITPKTYGHDLKTINLDYYINAIFSSSFRELNIHNNNNSLSLIGSSVEYTNKVKVYDLTDFFVWMGADASNILMRRVSNLRLTYYSELEFSTIALACDTTTEFFESLPGRSLVINPLNSLPPQQALRLIECFFCIHPYSLMINKTLLLQAYWTDTADPLLLTVIYGTTLFKSQLLEGKPLELWDALNRKDRNPFLDYAHVLLSETTIEATVSKYQAIVLLALFECSFGFPKKGMTLFGLSQMISAQMGLFSNSLPLELNEVERETLLLTYWASYETTMRGCVELEQIPRAALCYGLHPFPPPNMHASKSYQYDLMNNNPRLFKNYNFLVETFYVKAVIANFNCELILQLPEFTPNELDIKVPSSRIRLSDKYGNPIIQKKLPVIEDEAVLEENIQKVLRTFKETIELERHTWSPLQSYTLDLFYSFNYICLAFLRKTLIKTPPIAARKFGAYKRILPSKLDLTNVQNVLTVNRTIPECIHIIQRSSDFLTFTETKSENHSIYIHSRFLPRGIIISTLDAASQVLMYAYTLDSTRGDVRRYLEMADSLLALPDIWGDWDLAESVRSVIDSYLKQHPTVIIERRTVFDDTLPLPSSSIIPEWPSSNSSSGVSDMMASADDNIMNELYNTNFIDNPWPTDQQEPWIQDITDLLFSDSVLINGEYDTSATTTSSYNNPTQPTFENNNSTGTEFTSNQDFSILNDFFNNFNENVSPDF